MPETALGKILFSVTACMFGALVICIGGGAIGMLAISAMEYMR